MPLLLDLPDQTLVDPKPHSFATRTPCTWGHSTTGRGRDCQSLDSDVLANKESASTRSAISVPKRCWLLRTEFSVGTGALGLSFLADRLHDLPDRVYDNVRRTFLIRMARTWN
jgi:hypothetical protein